jgi:hypothetical protein
LGEGATQTIIRMRINTRSPSEKSAVAPSFSWRIETK